MRRIIKVKRGYDIPLEGAVRQEASPRRVDVSRVAVIPADFFGFTPKLAVKEGEHVDSLQPLLFDKNNPDIKIVSPASGFVEAVVRGERRRIERVIVKLDGENTLFTISGDDFAQRLKASGLWTMMRQRPFDIVPDPESVPRDIFVTAFDSAPLASPLFNETDSDDIRAAVKALAPLTSGKIYISVRRGSGFPEIEGAEIVEFDGPHPAGLPGVQAANIRPVNKGETIWTLDLSTLVRIGQLARTGQWSTETDVTVCGPEVKHPYVAKTLIGAELRPLLDGQLKGQNLDRIISGNVLTGHACSLDDFLRFPYRQVTVIRDGSSTAEFLGWASVAPSKLSLSPALPFKGLKKLFSPDSRIGGGRRAMILSGEYDKYIPMDIMAEYLVKAVLSEDIERMEALGIYEVAPEDFALAEFADASKLPLQKIIRQGLDKLRKE